MIIVKKKMPRPIAERHARLPSLVSVTRNSRITAANLAVMNLALRGIEADRESSSDEMRAPNCVFPNSTFEIQHSSFASLPGQILYSTTFWKN